MLVVDFADLLEDEELDALNARAEEISARQGVDVAILTVDSCEGEEPLQYAADFYDYNNYGQGVDHDGVMLMLAMEERDWAILTTGWAIDVFSDDTQRTMSREFRPYLSDGDYAGAFDRFLSMADVCLQQAAEWDEGDVASGEFGPEDWYSAYENRSALERTLEKMGYVAIAAAVITAIALAVMSAQMKTARAQRGAVNYIRDGSMAVTRQREIFLYRSQVRRKIESDDNHGSHGGSSTFTSSSGTTHGGSSGKF